MGRIDKTVFISYRRTNLPWALAIYQNLRSEGYDVFFDYLNIPSGDFETIIVENIKARAHFVVILTPSALERCNEPGDWLRREIETAMDEKRNIVPLMLESFDFGSPSTVKELTGKLENIKKYNGLRLHSEYFFEGMDRLRKQFLNVSLDTVVHPISESTKPATEQHKTAASDAPQVEKVELTAQEWFERGYAFFKARNLDEANRCYTESIKLESDNARPYMLRGIARYFQKEYIEATSDLNHALHLDPNSSEAHAMLGVVNVKLGDLDSAINEFDSAISLDPKDADIYLSRGIAWYKKNQYQKSLIDYQKYLELGGVDESDKRKEVEERIKDLKRNLTKKKTTRKKPK